MIYSFVNGRKYVNTDDYSPLSSEVWELQFSTSSWYIDDKEVRKIKKLSGQQPQLYDADNNYIGSENVIPVFEFVLSNNTGAFSSSFLNNVNEVIPNVTFDNTNCVGILGSDVNHYGDTLVYGFKANTNYSLIKAHVRVLMGGVDVTNQYYDNDVKLRNLNGVEFTGTLLSIPNVTADLYIEVDAVAITTLAITYVTSHIDATTPDDVDYGSDVSITLDYEDGYSINEDLHIYVGDVDVINECNITWVVGSVTILVPAKVVTDDINVVADALTNPTITYDLTGCSNPLLPNNMQYHVRPQFNLYKDDGYTWDEHRTYLSIDGVVIRTMDSVVGLGERLLVQVNPLVHVTGNIVLKVTAGQIHTFNFYKKDGTLGNTYSGVRITKLKVLHQYGVVSITINGNNVIQYAESLSEDERFMGLTLTAGGSLVYIPVNVETSVNFETNKNFYDVIKSAPTPVTDFHIILYKSSAEVNKVDKTNFLELVDDLTGTLRTQTTFVNPVIILEIEDLPTFNYVYIPKFNRYYFVTDIASVNKNIWAVSMHVDVLMSYKDVIRAQVGLIARQENDYNDEIVDDKRVMTQTPNIEVVELPETIFNVTEEGESLQVDKGIRYVLTCVKGND